MYTFRHEIHNEPRLVVEIYQQNERNEEKRNILIASLLITMRTNRCTPTHLCAADQCATRCICREMVYQPIQLTIPNIRIKKKNVFGVERGIWHHLFGSSMDTSEPIHILLPHNDSNNLTTMLATRVSGNRNAENGRWERCAATRL